METGKVGRLPLLNGDGGGADRQAVDGNRRGREEWRETGGDGRSGKKKSITTCSRSGWLKGEILPQKSNKNLTSSPSVSAEAEGQSSS